MATELTTFAGQSQTATFWDLYVSAAKFMYGDNIVVLRKPWVLDILDNISFAIYVESTGQQVIEKTRTVVDITTKEYTNRSYQEVDETLLRVKKNRFSSKESQYQFRPLNGVNWGMGGNIGAKVMGLSMSGGYSVVGGYNTHKSSSHAFEADFNFSYEQEERIKVPPLSHMKATMTSYIIKYEQEYTLRFCIPSAYEFPVMYKNICNQMFCSNTTGNVTASQLLLTLPHFKDEYGMASFVQQGFLSWMGEGIKVDKNMTLLRQEGVAPHTGGGGETWLRQEGVAPHTGGGGMSLRQEGVAPHTGGGGVTNSLVGGNQCEKKDLASYSAI